MQSHVLLLSIFSFFVSIIFGVMMREDTGAQVKLALQMFGGLVGAAIVLGWLMYPFPL